MDKLLPSDKSMKLMFCGCGQLHVTCGPVTLHFRREEFLDFADRVGRLAAMVKQTPAGFASAVRQSEHTEVCH